MSLAPQGNSGRNASAKNGSREGLKGALPAPYEKRARQWFKSGIAFPLPLPAGKKYPPPVGFTGWDGKEPSVADLTGWLLDNPHANIAGRLAKGVIGIDVDAYDGKTGHETLAKLGIELPPTYSITSRGKDSLSRIYLYRAEDRKWHDLKDIEVVHFGHRYVLLPESVHPSGATYRGYQADGNLADEVPQGIDTLAELPSDIMDAFSDGAASHSEKVQASRSEVSKWLEALPSPGTPCQPVQAKAHATIASLKRLTPAEKARHGTSLSATASLIAMGGLGHKGVPQALEQVRTAFTEALSGDRNRQPVKEFQGQLDGAVRMVMTDHAVPSQSDPCDEPVVATRIDSVVNVASPSPELPADFWDANKTLTHVLHAAQNRKGAPDAVLGISLARVVANAPHNLKLPPFSQGRAGLSLLVAPVAPSGLGKTGASNIAWDLIGRSDRLFPECDPVLEGTTQGLVEVLMESTGFGGQKRQSKFNVFAYIDEGENVEAGLYKVYRQIFTDAALGSTNAGKSFSRRTDRGSYNYGLVIGLQPEILFARVADSTEVGTVQRFLFVTAAQERLPKEKRPDFPGRINTEFPKGWEVDHRLQGEEIGGRPLHEFFVPKSLIAEVDALDDALHTQKLHSPQTVHNSHEILLRWKVGAALAILCHGKPDYTREDWELAGVMVETSNRVRDYNVDRHRDLIERKQWSSDERHAIRSLREMDHLTITQENRSESVREKVLEMVAEGKPSTRDIRETLSAEQRSLLANVLAELESEGILQTVTVGRKKAWEMVKDG